MASVERTVKIIFGAVDETSQAFESVGKGLQKVEDRLGSITDPLAKTADALIKFEATVAAVGVAFLGFSLNESIKFGSALNDVGKQLDGGVDQAEGYKKAIFDLSERFGVSSEQIAGSFAEFLQAGINVGEVLDLVTNNLELVATSELTTAEATEALIKIIKGFEFEVSEIPRALDLINEATNEYALNTGQLSDALARTGSVAERSGFEFEELIGVLVPMIEKTQSAELTSTAFNTTLQRMTSLNSEVAKGFTLLGIRQTDASGAIKSGSQILREAQAAYQDLTDDKKNLVAQYLSGQDQATKFATVLEQSNRTLEITDRIVKGVGNSIEKELAVKLSSAKKQLEQTQQAFVNLGIVIGDQFKVETAGAVDAVGELITTFRKIVDEGGLKPLFDQLRPLLVSFEQSIRDIAAVLPDAFAGLNFDALTNGFTELGNSVQSLFGDVDLTTADGLRKALQDIINVGGNLIQTTSGIVDGIKPFLQTAAQLVQEFGELNPEIAKGGGEIIGYGKAINTLLGPIGALGEGLTGLGEGLKVVAASSIIKSLTDLTGASTKAAASFTGAKGLVQAIKGNAGLLGAVGLGGFAVGTLASDLIDDLIPGVDTLGTKLFDLLNPSEAAGEALGQMSFTAEDFGNKAVAAGNKVQNLIDPTSDLTTEEEKLEQATFAANKALLDQWVELENVGGSLDETILATNDYNNAQQTTEQYGKSLVKITVDAETGLKTYSQAVDITAKSLDGQAASTDEAKKKTEQFVIEMEKIASNERIKNIEAKVSLDIASLEAETKRVEAAFTSIDTAVKSTGDLLGSLFGSLEGASRWNQLLIEDQISLENERREKALKKQNELIDAQIDNLRERTRQLARGDAIIKISGDGLEPELEAFMWEIVKKVRVRATSEGQEFLLGV